MQHSATLAKRPPGDGSKSSNRITQNIRLCCAFLLILLRSHPPKGSSRDLALMTYFFSDFLTETTDRHLLKDVQSQLNCSTLVNILKTFMAVSSDVIRSKVNSASFLSISIRADCYASKENSHFLKKETSKDISEMAFQFLKIICSESWVKEKCLKDVDQFNTNLLVSFSDFFIFDNFILCNSSLSRLVGLKLASRN